MDCPFALVTSLWTCPQCGYVYPRPNEKPPRKNCPAASIRSDEEVARLAALCRTNDCGAFDPIGDACRLCGCASGRRAAWKSRLRLGRCPKGKW